MSIEGQGHFFTIYFPGFVLCFSRPRYQVSVYRTIGPLVICGDSLGRGTEVCINGPGNMTKMTATAIYGKNPSNASSP